MIEYFRDYFKLNLNLVKFLLISLLINSICIIIPYNSIKETNNLKLSTPIQCCLKYLLKPVLQRISL